MINCCKNCGQCIKFIRTKKNNKWVPAEIPAVTVRPNQTGETGGHSYIMDDGRVFHGRVLPPDWPYDGVSSVQAYAVHFENCPGAEQFRKKK